MLDYDMIRAFQNLTPAFTKTADPNAMTPEKLAVLIQVEEIVIDKLEHMPQEVVEGYKPGLKILGEMIQKGINGSKS